MSAWWILPALTFVASAIVLWWVGREVADEAAALRQELGEWDAARSEAGRLRAEARQVGAGYRDLRRR